MSLALTEKNAWEEVFSLFKKQIPTLANASAADYNPALIKQDPENTSRVLLAITAKNPDVVKGNVVVSYERADLQKLLNTFADKTKKPELGLSIIPGARYKLSQFIDQLNNVLGMELVIKGASGHYDIIDTEFTAPDKGQIVSVTIGTDAIPVDGSYLTMPLRVSNAKTGSVNVSNRGITIDKAIVNRDLNPFVNADNTLNAGIEPTDITKPIAPSILLKLYNMDFTDVFGTVPLFNSRFQRVSSSNFYPARLTPAALQLINAKLVREGIAPIPLDRGASAIDVVPCDNYAGPELADFTGTDTKRSSFFGVISQPFKGMNNYYPPLAGDRGGKTPPHVNRTFKYFVRLAPLGKIVTSYSDMPSDHQRASDKLPLNQRPLYLFFNDLI